MSLFYAFLGMLCLGLAPLFGKSALAGVNPITAFALRTLIAALLMTTWYASAQGFSEFKHLSGSFWVVISIEAVLAALLGDLAYFLALKNGNINEVSLIMSCAPLITITMSYLVFGELVSFSQLVGAFLIIVGLVIINWG